MNPTAQIQALANSVYLRIKNRFYDDLTSPDGVAYVNAIIDFGNGFLDELENEVNPDGKPLDWDWVTQLGYTLGTAAINTASITLPSTINNVIVDEERYIQVVHGGIVVSNWLVVSPSQITNKTNRIVDDTCTVTGSTLTFSRLFKDFEDQGTIIGDVTLPFPRLSLTNAASIKIIKPRELLVLGIAKNASLPDIVKGGLSPSYVQKYNDLLQNAIMRNTSSSTPDNMQRTDYGSIRGIF
jgi:hypothetical protein